VSHFSIGEIIMTAIKTLSTSAVAAIQAVAVSASHHEKATLKALPVLQAEFKGVDRDIIRETVIVNFAAAVGIKLNVAKTGRVTFPANAETAKRACNRFIERIMGDSKPKAKPDSIEVPAHIAKLAAQLAKACNDYEQARKIANTAVAQAFAK
jgi:hypothetical protein